jgi:hypothetical protein
VSLFRRRGRETDDEAAQGTGDEVALDQDSLGDDDVDPGDLDSDGSGPGETGVRRELFDDEPDDDEPDFPADPPSDRTQGPWDLAERGDLEGYVDLGGIRLRGRDGMELRLELDEATGGVSSATVQLGQSAVQLQAFAAPRSEGIWGEIRREIALGIERQGGHADEVPGPFGRELIARIPARSPDGRTGFTAARFVGVDGPRWFLRAVFHGEAVHTPEAAGILEDVVRDLVVVRGAEAMAPRELLVLRLPEAPESAESPADGQAEEPAGAPGRDDLRPFERGPEITEVR